MPQVRIGNAPLEALRGDLTEQGVEAIVTAANNHLWMGVGAIKHTGPQIGAATDHLASTSYIERLVFVLSMRGATTCFGSIWRNSPHHMGLVGCHEKENSG